MATERTRRMGKRAGKRYVNEIKLDMDPVYVENSIQAYLRQNDFKPVNEAGEDFYKTGGAMRCFKYGYNNGVLHIEAWLGKIGKEHDISDGKLVGSAYKIPYYNSVLSLLGALEKDRQMQQYMGAQSPDQANSQPYGAYVQPNSAVLQEINKTNDRNAVIAFWLSIGALVLVFGSKLSLLVNVSSYYLAFTYGLKSGKRGMAVAAIVINSIATLIAILILLGGILG